jgi:hypothetical protein
MSTLFLKPPEIVKEWANDVCRLRITKNDPYRDGRFWYCIYATFDQPMFVHEGHDDFIRFAGGPRNITYIGTEPHDPAITYGIDFDTPGDRGVEMELDRLMYMGERLAASIYLAPNYERLWMLAEPGPPRDRVVADYFRNLSESRLMMWEAYGKP